MKTKLLVPYLILLTVLLFSCDFTPPFLKGIKKAQSFLYEQKYEEALVLYKKVLKRNPSREIRVKILYQIADIYSIYIGENKKSLKYYLKVIDISEDPLWLVKAEERIAEVNFTYLKNYIIAENSYNKLSSFTPRLSKHNFYEYRLALSKYLGNTLNKSKKIFEKISKNNGHKYYAKSIYYLGLIEFHQKNWLKAIQYWKNYIKVEKIKGSITQAKFMMANAYETLEELKMAYNIYYSILGEYPNHQIIKNRLNAIYKRRISRKR